jgi:hypothetical protein
MIFAPTPTPEFRITIQDRHVAGFKIERRAFDYSDILPELGHQVTQVPFSAFNPSIHTSWN